MKKQKFDTNTDSLWKKIKLSLTNAQNYSWYQCFNIGLEHPIKLEADKEYEICLIIDQDISTLYINGTALNARLCDHPGNGLALTVDRWYTKKQKIQK